MTNERLSEVLLIQNALIEAGRPVTAVYEVDRTSGTARMSGVRGDQKNKILFSHTINYGPQLLTKDKKIISDLYRGCMTGGLE